jgi:mannitol-1-phosphate/altronate dehydrogenase
MTEPFTQWVIEDSFANERPAFELAGAQMVEDVEPFELMKLRMLNGSHSTMAYLGYLSGYQLVSEAIADPAIRSLVHGLMTEEAIPTLPMDKGELGSYRDQLIARFANPALKHRTPWMARKNCRNACSAPSATASPQARAIPASRWESQRGCATSPASMNRASRST